MEFRLSVRFRYMVGAAGVFAMVTLVFVAVAPFWRNTAQQISADIFDSVYAFEGLWLTCLYQARRVQCIEMGIGWPQAYGYQSVYLSQIMAYLNAFRAFMIIALVLSLAGVVCSALGMRCTTVMDEDSKAKRWVVIGGGVCHLSAGLLTGVCASWYAAQVVREYYDPYYQNQKMKYTLGACLYVGWLSMVCSLLCGCLMVCCTCFNKPVDDEYDEYGYKGHKSQEKYSMPIAYDDRRSNPYSYHHKPDYYPSSGRNYYRSKDKRRSSYSDDHHKSSRHSSDIIRSSGYI